MAYNITSKPVLISIGMISHTQDILYPDLEAPGFKHKHINSQQNFKGKNFCPHPLLRKEWEILKTFLVSLISFKCIAYF